MAITTVAVVAFDRISPFHLSIPCTVFGENRTDLGLPEFSLRVCALTPGPFRTSVGFAISTPCTLADIDSADIVVVPSWPDDLPPPPVVLLDALRAAHARGARVVGLCLGSFVLAEAGLLDGRRATTHWLGASAFEQRYPRVTLDADVLYVDDGGVLTSAGSAAALDCCLYLVRERYGAEVANRLARRLVVPPHRAGGQAQYIEHPVPASASEDRLSETLQWALARLAQPLSLDRMAAQALMSRRTFTRRFRQLTGTTVGKWVLMQRLAQAQRLLECSDLSVERIAADCGLGAAVSLRQHFAAAFATSPSAYRRAFRGGQARADES
jgi:transcriptional regulator GlxA family with amidase domain